MFQAAKRKWLGTEEMLDMCMEHKLMGREPIEFATMVETGWYDLDTRVFTVN